MPQTCAILVLMRLDFLSVNVCHTCTHAVGFPIRVILDQNVIVENRPGAAGRIALSEVKNARPDGNTLVMAPSGGLVILPWLYKNLGYDSVKDFTPIARVTTFDFVVTVGPSAPVSDIKGLLNWLKTHPNQSNYATSGAGTVPHFAGQLFAQETGIQLTHVAYKGGAPAAQDLDKATSFL